MTEMAEYGMNVVRMNLSHGNYAFHRETVKNTRKVSKLVDKHIGILMDLQGPKIRTGNLQKGSVLLKKDEYITLTTDDIEGNWEVLSVNYTPLPEEAKRGDRIYLEDGNIELKVVDTAENKVVCKILNGGTISSNRGVNLPDTQLSTPSLTEKDIRDLDFGLDIGVDYVALSFVRTPGAILDLKDRIERKGKRIPVIAKIEKPEAINNLDDIIQVSDGIMVARGDLGAETSPQDVPILQKMIIQRCNLNGKAVITATQMLESMVHRPRPTRAEASDVANAIFDGTDAVMLSEETAVGEYPVKAVQVMTSIAEKAELDFNRERFTQRDRSRFLEKDNIADSMCFSAFHITRLIHPVFLLSFTLTGKTAILLSKYRPTVPILAMSPSEEVLRILSLYWGVHGIYIGNAQTSEELISEAEKILVNKKLCNEDDTVIVIGGVPVLAGEPTNMVKVHKVRLGNRNI
jgi:pyruvate kinase